MLSFVKLKKFKEKKNILNIIQKFKKLPFGGRLRTRLLLFFALD